MAGMLPGVESARRRRFHNTNLSYGGSDLSPSPTTATRSSFCLSSTALCEEESRLSTAAREARKRLDQRLQPHWRSSSSSSSSSSQFNRIESRSVIEEQRSRSTLDSRARVEVNLQGEEPKLKRSGSKRLNWLKQSWKSSEQDECAVCLEHFRAGRGGGGGGGGGTLMQLPCGHKFHTNCLMPWLEANAHCPCCRMQIIQS